jgi:hypothetical protein
MMAKRTKKFAIKRKTKTLKLKGDLEGGEVVVAANTPMSMLFQIMGVDTAGTKEQEKLIRQFGEDVLVSWNFTNEEGEDLPATGDGVVSLDNETFTGIVDVWIESLGGDKNLDSQPSEQETSV